MSTQGAVMERVGTLAEVSDQWISTRPKAQYSARVIQLVRGPASVIEVDVERLPKVRLVDAGDITVI
jgi:hypothetical protein